MKHVIRFETRDKASSYNRTWRDRLRTQWLLLRHRGIKVGANTVILPGNEFKLTDGAKIVIGSNCTIKENSYFLLTKPFPVLEMGNFSGIGRNCYIAIKDRLRIGSFVRMGPDVCILDQGHSFKRDELIMNQKAIIAPVTICDDVWIGRGATILKGVTIGEGSVLGAGAVVTKSIPPYEIWGGIPARFIKKRE